MQKTEFNIALEKEIESLVSTFPNVDFYPWLDALTETTVITVVPSETLNSKDFVKSQLEMRKRLSKLFTERIITFRSAEDRYFPFKKPDLPVQLSGLIIFGSLTSFICASGEYGGFEKINLVNEETILSDVAKAHLVASKSAFNANNNSLYSSTYNPDRPLIYSDAA